MSTFVALGAAVVEADDAAEAAERAEYEDVPWKVRHVCTEKDWWSLERTSKRPWLGRISVLTLPALAYGAFTGENILWSAAAMLGLITSG